MAAITSRSFFHTRRLVLAVSWLVLLASTLMGQSRPTRISVLDFGSNQTSFRAATAIRELLRSWDGNNAPIQVKEVEVVDPDQTRAAAIGAGYKGSLNLELQQARDLGAAIGCDFYFLGDAQTVERSPSSGAGYYESFASIFLVSSRTGRLVLWERPTVERDSAEKSEKTLLAILSSDETNQHYVRAIRWAFEDERAERAAAIEAHAQVIDIMSDDYDDSNKELRGPRPYRRLKPIYPETAARADVEATVDVLVDIDARGEVGRTEIARWAGYGLDQSVIDTVRQMHFFPAMRNDIAIPTRVLLRYNFRKPPKPISTHQKR